MAKAKTKGAGKSRRKVAVKAKPKTGVERAVRAREHPALRQLSEICLSLPEAARRDLSEHADFRVRGKVLAYFLNNHHGDGIVSVPKRLLSKQ
jgi:hypothetical protein